MSSAEIDLTACDREPIHIPGSIQPHGLLLVAEPASLRVTHVAGDPAHWLGDADWRGADVMRLLGEEADETARLVAAGEVPAQFAVATAGGLADVAVHLSGGHLLIELEPAWAKPRNLLPQLEGVGAAFERATHLKDLCEIAAREFQRLTGYARVMVYRFLADEAGVVIAEHVAPGQQSFLNHHFPATDIPRQARALYVRNRVRVIPDVGYRPAPLEPRWSEERPLDLSDSILRSVSPVHIQYLKNMGVAASASISIVKDGALWGLIACHNDQPLPIPAAVRGACRALAGGLARQIKAREETDSYRERVRLRSFEDDIVALLSREGSLNDAISNHLGELMKMLGADGVAVLRGPDLVSGGRCPSEGALLKLAGWAVQASSDQVFATDALGEHYTLPPEDQPLAAGLLAITISASEPWIVLWFRAEEIMVVDWAGNPHKNVTLGAGGALDPRASFDKWTETVRGRARRWTIPEVEAAGHLRAAVMEVWHTRRIRELNRELVYTLEQKDLLIRQKEFLIGEVNHRVQNSLQLVSSFLGLQARELPADSPLHAPIEEARRRISAVSLVHRRLYRSDQLEAVDAARYLDEVIVELVSSMGAEWKPHVLTDLEPVLLPTDRAVALGLVVTELVINAVKYAYNGAPGPLRASLVEERNRFRLTIADDGVGRAAGRKGFGSRMMDALVVQIGGTLEFEDNRPGTKAVLSAEIELPKRR